MYDGTDTVIEDDYVPTQSSLEFIREFQPRELRYIRYNQVWYTYKENYG